MGSHLIRQATLSEFPAVRARTRSPGWGGFCPDCGLRLGSVTEAKEHRALHRDWKYRGTAICASCGHRQAHYWENGTWRAFQCEVCGPLAWNEGPPEVVRRGLEAVLIVGALSKSITSIRGVR